MSAGTVIEKQPDLAMGNNGGDIGTIADYVLHGGEDDDRDRRTKIADDLLNLVPLQGNAIEVEMVGRDHLLTGQYIVWLTTGQSLN